MLLQPWLWFLTRSSDCKIYYNLAADAIVQQVFRDNGFSAGRDFGTSLSGTYATREYCIQYRETAFDFVSRLMEQEGIYYYFTHSDQATLLKLSDAHGSHQATGGAENVPYVETDLKDRTVDHIAKWDVDGQVQPGTYVLNDFDFEKPTADLKVTSQVERQHAMSSFAMYDYPGGYVVSDAVGDPFVKARLTEFQAEYEQYQAESNVRGLITGGLFSLTGHPRSAYNREYLITAMSYEFQAHESGTADDAGQGLDYSFKLTVIPSAQQYRPPRVTPKPLVRGPQTAIVVGPTDKEGEILTDKNGRVKLKFHWDRYFKSYDETAFFVRVAQVWAGKNWGAIHIPRVGQEVIVDFLEGNPDRPIITGRVYNADEMPPYTLPDNKTQSGIKSRSSNGSQAATADNFNELRFEDLNGSEEIYFHAEKDFNRVVENNDTLKVGFDKKDKGDQTVEIHNNQKLVVGNSNSDDGSQTIEIWKDRTATVKEGNEKLEIQKGNRDVIVTKGNDTHTISTGNRDVQIDTGNDTLTVKKGDQTVQITLGKSSTEAGTSIELKVGGSSIKIEPAAITIKSTSISIEAQAALQAKGATATVDGGGALTLKGGIVNIN